MSSSSNPYPVIRGALKLKGASTAGITKKKKKKTKASAPSPNTTAALETALAEEEDKDGKSAGNKTADRKDADGDDDDARGQDGSEDEDAQKLKELDPRDHDGKTASERAHEEMRRRRLQDRLAKEGVKTHKQRVEELNKYLSNLSEHHDMPRIGPG